MTALQKESNIRNMNQFQFKNAFILEVFQLCNHKSDNVYWAIKSPKSGIFLCFSTQDYWGAINSYPEEERVYRYIANILINQGATSIISTRSDNYTKMMYAKMLMTLRDINIMFKYISRECNFRLLVDISDF